MTDVEPLYRMTLYTLKELIELHDSFPNEPVESLLETLEIDGDYSEYGA